MSDLPPSKSAPQTNITVLISGKGSNLGKLIEATQSGLLAPHRIIRVISNRINAGGLKLAEEAHIPTTYHNLIAGGYHAKGEKDGEVIRQAREKYDADLAKKILEDRPDLVVCGMLRRSSTNCGLGLTYKINSWMDAHLEPPIP